MNVAIRKSMSQAEFFAWAEGQEERYEFDGIQPGAMTGGTMNHGATADNIRAELKQRLRGGPCRSVGSDGAGIETVGEAWGTTVLGKGDVLALPEIGIEIPVAAIYDDVTFDGLDRHEIRKQREALLF